MIKVIFLFTALSGAAKDADSLRMEIINGKKFVIHQVDEKETLYGLSRRYGASLQEILEYNASADAGLEVGQILKIPYVERAPRPAGKGNVHVVGAGETLFSISRMYQVTVDDLKQWNNLGDHALAVGQELVIKKGGQGQTAAAPVPVEKGFHRVAQGETLFAISRTYQVTVNDLKSWNALTGSDIAVGQLLRVASPEAAAAPTTLPATETVSPVQENPKETTIRISENVAGSNEIRESGLAELIEGTEGNRKYLALHRSAPTGTILKVRSELNNREVFVRVVGPLPPTGLNDPVILKISKSAFDRLGAIDPRFRVEVTYFR